MDDKRLAYKLLIYRNRLHKLYLKGLVSKQYYINYRNTHNKLILFCKNEYFIKLFDDKVTGIKNMWKNMGPILNPRKSKSPSNINKLVIDRANIHEDQDIADSLNDHFTSVGPKLAEKLDISKNKFTHYLKNPNPNSFFMSPVTENYINDILYCLQPNKSPGFDGISNKILKISRQFIIKPLTHIINLSFKHGVFQIRLKLPKLFHCTKKVKNTFVQIIVLFLFSQPFIRF